MLYNGDKKWAGGGGGREGGGGGKGGRQYDRWRMHTIPQIQKSEPFFKLIVLRHFNKGGEPLEGRSIYRIIWG